MLPDSACRLLSGGWFAGEFGRNLDTDAVQCIKTLVGKLCLTHESTKKCAREDGSQPMSLLVRAMQ